MKRFNWHTHIISARAVGPGIDCAIMYCPIYAWAHLAPRCRLQLMVAYIFIAHPCKYRISLWCVRASKMILYHKNSGTLYLLWSVTNSASVYYVLLSLSPQLQNRLRILKHMNSPPNTQQYAINTNVRAIQTRKCISCRKCVRMLKHLWLNSAEYFEKAEHILKKLNIFWKSWRYFEKVENILKKLNIFWKSWKYFEKVEHVLKRLNSLIFERFPQLKCGWRS